MVDDFYSRKVGQKTDIQGIVPRKKAKGIRSSSMIAIMVLVATSFSRGASRAFQKRVPKEKTAGLKLGGAVLRPSLILPQDF